ncbi:MAG TPA: HAD family hydrolase [Methylomirabilota bacterium]|nr:HAD family hydrolase [Methylomirabilota bacterium]
MARPALARRPAAVLFDFGGTLDAPGITWKERAWRLYREAGVATEPATFGRAFYDADDALVGAVPPALPLEDTVRRVFAGVSARLGVADAPLTERLAGRFLDEAHAHLRVSAAVLARLARRYRLGIVSNFYGNLAAICAQAGLAPPVAAIADSAVVGATKPDARIFSHALDALGVAPGDAAFVGDSRPRDMEGARALAMPHVWVVERGLPAAAPCCAGDPVIRGLDELEALLECDAS